MSNREHTSSKTIIKLVFIILQRQFEDYITVLLAQITNFHFPREGERCTVRIN